MQSGSPTQPASGQRRLPGQTLRDWPGSIVAIDIGWGVVLSAITAMAASVAWQLLRPR